jgi:hypothetical protein
MEQDFSPERGEHYLELLGVGHLADKEATVRGQTMPTREFLLACGEHVLPMLVGFEGLHPDHPQRERARGVIVRRLGALMGYDESQQQRLVDGEQI